MDTMHKRRGRPPRKDKHNYCNLNIGLEKNVRDELLRYKQGLEKDLGIGLSWSATIAIMVTRLIRAEGETNGSDTREES